MQVQFTAVFRKVPERGYVAFVEELPGRTPKADFLKGPREPRRAVALVLEFTGRPV